MKELWRTIPKFELYECSNKGRIRSWKPYRNYAKPPSIPRLMKGKPDKDGYLWIALYSSDKKKNVWFRLARLILLIWKPNQTPKHALHKNGVVTDNRVSNLYWGTPKQNSADSKRHGTWVHGESVNTCKLTENMVKYVKRSKKGNSELARKFGTTPGAIWHIRAGRTWKHVKC